MKSKTSFFNPGVLKKDILRFSPLWGIYTVFMLLYLFLSMANSFVPAEFAGNADNIMEGMGIVNFAYGILSALLLFGDLFKSRLCNALHAMPLRREGWFFTHLTAGLLFCILPNTLGAVISSVYLGSYGYLAWLWLAVMVLEYLCFFGIGVFSVQLAGNALGAIATYLITNLLAVLAAALLQSFYAPVLYGIQLDYFGQRLSMLSPLLRFVESPFVEISCQWDPNPILTVANFRGYIAGDWRYLFAAAGTGLLFLGGSLVLYRKRDLEKAGDFLSVRSAKPVFLLLYTLIVGGLFYLAGELFNSSGQYVLLVIGFVIGFFTGWMLLEKRLKVFTGKRFLALGIFAVTFFLTIGITWLDPLGITRYVPQTDKIESVTISPYGSKYYYTTKESNRTLTEKADIDVIRDLHRELATVRDEKITVSQLQITYTLTNGATVTREYGVDADSPTGQILRGYYSHMDALFGGEDPRMVLFNSEVIEFTSNRPEEIPSILFTDQHNYWGSTDPKDIYGENYLEIFTNGSFADDVRIQGLLDAIEQDCLEGNMAQLWEYHKDDNPVGYLVFATHKSADIQIYGNCLNTVAYLKSLATIHEGS